MDAFYTPAGSRDDGRKNLSDKILRGLMFHHGSLLEQLAGEIENAFEIKIFSMNGIMQLTAFIVART